MHGRRVLVLALLDVGAKPAERVAVGGADDATVKALEAHGVHPAPDAHVVGDLGDGADGGVLVLVRVTFMPGKTTVSSSGTSSRSVTADSHSKV